MPSPRSRPSFDIQTRAQFDQFWVSGVEMGRTLTLADLNALAAGSPAAAQVNTRPDGAPVVAQVWWKYRSEEPGKPVDLLVDPANPLGQPALTSKQVLALLQQSVIDGTVSLESTTLAEGFGCVAINLPFEHMVTRLLPLTTWRPLLDDARACSLAQLREAVDSYGNLRHGRTPLSRIGWFAVLIGICGHWQTERKNVRLDQVRQVLQRAGQPPVSTPIGRVTLNRSVAVSVHRSRRTVKADASISLFGIRCDEIRWAVVDSGIDARHEWFRRINPADGRPWPRPFDNDGVEFNFTRVTKAYNFARQRLSGAQHSREAHANEVGELPSDVPIALDVGPRFYEPPAHGHGTHVAGIIGGAGGICPDIELIDYRVLHEDGRGQEFEVVGALRHILEVTQQAAHADPTGRDRDLPIHGVNLSIALDADVTSDACGWSLVCRACDDLVRAGVVVVVSAGNTGFEDRTGQLLSTGQDYRIISITDPGNTERVITVGSTDADRPWEYGISYFSARGPTADGRPKPDLVAPGNAITSAYGYKRGGDDQVDAATTLKGTSMAAAHVSGCAALLLARHRELIGKPDEVKRILMASATDLRRDRNFQGAGLVDALRAIQSV